MAKNNETLFSRLTQLFRGGPIVRRKVRNYRGPTAQTALQAFGHGANDVYNSAISAYGTFDRMSRYSDFSEMEATPEIASALDIYSEECAPSDDKGTILHIHSDNRKVIELLENLFYDILNVEFNLPMWVRNLCKYGDFFMFVDVSPEYGVVNGYPIPIAEIEREEAYDENDPTAVRFRWITRGNAILENWQIAHFRLLGNDAFLPYGSSVLESARRIWRQLILIEDAMLVYRIIRAPERRVFYIDVGAVPPEDVPNYMQAAQSQLKRNQIIDRNTGKVDMRYNPLSVDEDYFLPVRGDTSGTKIDTLAGGQNASDIDDVKYIQSKLFSALKIPKAYLGYDEGVGAKATLAQEDIRFSRTIQRIQKTIISELNKIAIIHLYSHGFTDEDLLDFELSLTNPSTLAQQQKLELIKSQFEIAGQAPESIVDITWVRKNVFGFSDAVSAEIERGREMDMQRAAELENIGTRGVDDSPPDFGGGGEAPVGDEGGESVEDLFASDLPVGRIRDKGTSIRLLEDDDEEDDEIDFKKLSIKDINAPLKAQNQIKRNVSGEPIKKSKKRHQPGEYGTPDWDRMVGLGRTDDTLRDPYGDPSNPNKIFSHHDRRRSAPPPVQQSPYEKFLDKKITQQAIMTKELGGTLKNMKTSLNINSSSGVLSESELLDLDEDVIITGEK
jgi:hypothetical protein